MQPESAFHVPAGLIPSQPACPLLTPTVQNQLLPIPSAHNAASSSTSAPAMSSSATLTLGSGIEESRKLKKPGKNRLPFGFIML